MKTLFVLSGGVMRGLDIQQFEQAAK